jgi:hypothetical protein
MARVNVSPERLWNTNRKERVLWLRNEHEVDAAAA